MAAPDAVSRPRRQAVHAAPRTAEDTAAWWPGGMQPLLWSAEMFSRRIQSSVSGWRKGCVSRFRRDVSVLPGVQVGSRRPGCVRRPLRVQSRPRPDGWLGHSDDLSHIGQILDFVVVAASVPSVDWRPDHVGRPVLVRASACGSIAPGSLGHRVGRGEDACHGGEQPEPAQGGPMTTGPGPGGRRARRWTRCSGCCVASR